MERPAQHFAGVSTRHPRVLNITYRKFFLLALALILAIPETFSQQGCQAVVQDTLHYFYNKYYFKTGVFIDKASGTNQFARYYASGATGTAVSHIGNKFVNDAEVDILGLEGFMERHKTTSTQTNVPIVIRLYLAEIDASGNPKLPPLDSVTIDMWTTTESYKPQGGNFATPRRITGDYAVLFRNMSSRSGDTIFVYRTSTMTWSATAPAAQKCSDGLGYVRHKGIFYSASSFTAKGFGQETDYEFLLAPRVQYTLTAGQITPADVNPADSLIYTHQQVTYTNTASPHFKSRFYNFIEFNTHWNQSPPFHPNTLQQFSFPDERHGISWHFYSEDNKNYYLPPGSDLLVFYTDSARKSLVYDPGEDSATQYIGNHYNANLWGMGLGGGKSKFSCREYFNYWTKFRPGDNVGLNEKSALSQVMAYPNPASGNIKLKGIEGTVNLEVYNMSGQLLLKKVITSPTANIDVSTLPAGNYLLRMSNESDVRTLKVLKAN
jgi:hypothetical protein